MSFLSFHRNDFIYCNKYYFPPVNTAMGFIGLFLITPFNPNWDLLSKNHLVKKFSLGGQFKETQSSVILIRDYISTSNLVNFCTVKSLDSWMQCPDAGIHQGKERQGAKLPCAVHCKEWKEDSFKSLVHELKATQKAGGEVGRGWEEDWSIM